MPRLVEVEVGGGGEDEEAAAAAGALQQHCGCRKKQVDFLQRYFRRMVTEAVEPTLGRGFLIHEWRATGGATCRQDLAKKGS